MLGDLRGIFGGDVDDVPHFPIGLLSGFIDCNRDSEGLYIGAEGRKIQVLIFDDDLVRRRVSHEDGRLLVIDCHSMCFPYCLSVLVPLLEFRY